MTAMASHEQVRSATTLMLQRLPRLFSRRDLYQHLTMMIHPEAYNMVYMPMSSEHQDCNIGIAFVNFNDEYSARACFMQFSNLRLSCRGQITKPCRPAWAPIQGLAANLRWFISKHGPLALNGEHAPDVFVSANRVPITVLYSALMNSTEPTSRQSLSEIHHPAMQATLGGRVHISAQVFPASAVGEFVTSGQLNSSLGCSSAFSPALEHAPAGDYTKASIQDFIGRPVHVDLPADILPLSNFVIDV
jgi:hypothetical protein